MRGPRQIEQILDDALTTDRLLFDDFQILRRRAVRRPQKNANVPENDRHRIVELVRHPGDDATDARERFVLHQADLVLAQRNRHLIEGARQAAELVGRVDLDARRQIAAAELLGSRLQAR